jgi:CDP-diacylglycerol--glycerol-3-phosphate 3-phosphatidyltransferase
MMTLPNILTLSRIGLIPVFMVLFYLQPNYLEGEPLPWINNSLVAIFILISLTDFFDGLLARRLNQISELGAFLDPVADKLMVCVSLILLTDYHHTWFITIPTIIIIFREILVSALREWMAEVGKRANIAVSKIGKSKTFMQMLAILFLLYQQPLLMFSKEDITLAGLALLFTATVLTLWSGFIYLLAGLKTFDS